MENQVCILLAQGICLDLPEPHFPHLSARDNISYLTILSQGKEENICQLCSSLHSGLSINLSSFPLLSVLKVGYKLYINKFHVTLEILRND